MVIRFCMIHSDTGQVESGANYPGCTAQTPDACRPQSFANFQDAKSYCDSHGEGCYVVGQALPQTPQWDALVSETWNFVSSPGTIDMSKVWKPTPVGAPGTGGGDNTLLYVGIAAVAAFLFLK
jgi:hypothetical protein